MTNLYYTPDGTPATAARGLSSQPRNQLAAVATGFDKLPTPTELGGATQNYAVDTGTVNNLVCAIDPNIVAYFDGMELVIKAAFTNTLSVTVTPGSLPIKAVVAQDGTALASNAFLTDQIISIRYNSTAGNFQYLVTSASAAAAAAAAGASAAIATAQAAQAAASATLAASHLLYIRPEERTSNTILGLTDAGIQVIVTANSFTQTFDTANFGGGWACLYQNIGSGEITIPLSDGVSNWKMYRGEERIFAWDAIQSKLYSSILNPFSVSYISSATFTKPPGYRYFGARLWSGAASGQRTNNVATLSMGGGGGGCADFIIPASSMGATETVTIGAGGAAVSAVANGNIGGATSIGSLAQVFNAGSFYQGGSIRSGMVSTTTLANTNTGTGYEGGNNAGGTDRCDATWGGAGATSLSTTLVPGNSIFGGGAGGSCSTAGAPTAGGTSVAGGSGGAAASTTNGIDGTAPGGGGGATQTGTLSGAGARGEARIWGIC